MYLKFGPMGEAGLRHYIGFYLHKLSYRVTELRYRSVDAIKKKEVRLGYTPLFTWGCCVGRRVIGIFFFLGGGASVCVNNRSLVVYC